MHRERNDIMLSYEQELWNRGLVHIAGIDEVGRGCLFGDVVAAAVVLPSSFVCEDIQDSKKLSEKKRDALYDIIQEQALAIGIGRVAAEEIDRINIKQAARLAMQKALRQMEIVPDYLLIDAERIETDIPQLSIVKGDSLSQSIAAASIIAKVTRDRLCVHWDQLYPQYGIAKHKGYATKEHREAIRTYGPCPLHRTSFLNNILAEQQTLF
ncbi:ribonuclease HII [Marinicrinis lubricantis]|uniref:Ribonuclease HII n=1 Tax=Marinicrinis lubricantis TaxID=2086470 RepID=A0ABW1IML8_9BACL